MGYSPENDHAEPGWAVELNFDEACTLGLCFRQHALYWVNCLEDQLFVGSFLCDSERRKTFIYTRSVLVGSLRAKAEERERVREEQLQNKDF